MGVTLLVVGLAGLGLLLLKGDGKYAAAFIKRSDGRLVYKAAVRDIVINQLLVKQIFPHNEEPTSMFEVVQRDQLVSENDSAYFALQFLHSQGRNIWTPQTYWLPTKEGVKTSVWFGLEDPPKKLGYALLISGADQWPPLPDTMSSIPSSVPPIPSA